MAGAESGARRRQRRLAALAVTVFGACARAETAWRRDLRHPDPFSRALAACALSARWPERACDAADVLLETVDRTELGLQATAARQLQRLGAPCAPLLVERWAADPFMTLERSAALHGALRAAGPRAREALLAMERAAVADANEALATRTRELLRELGLGPMDGPSR
jgi:hypothetical protein